MLHLGGSLSGLLLGRRLLEVSRLPFFPGCRRRPAVWPNRPRKTKLLPPVGLPCIGIEPFLARNCPFTRSGACSWSSANQIRPSRRRPSAACRLPPVRPRPLRTAAGFRGCLRVLAWSLCGVELLLV